jgi:molybdopterin-guanine dinucleotide biosynthesis protein MobB
MRVDSPPVVSIVGKKNSGKTTLTVAVATELKRRGYRVASMKHGHHEFEIDHAGRDSWRHFHEGETEAVLMVSSGKLALVMRLPDGEPDPRELVDRYFAGHGYDIVLAEGYKRGPFPKIEIFRSSVHREPLFDRFAPDADSFLALVSDRALPGLGPSLVLIDEEDGHISLVADIIEESVNLKAFA